MHSIFSIVRSITLATARRDADFPRSFTFDEVSELNRDASAALATIREWMNSLASINRLPLDVLSLIPTHLPSQSDRFRATFVCRHWRRTFLQNATLWSDLCLSKAEVYVKTLLERAKGSPLSILASGADPADIVMLLLPHTKQIAEVKFTNNRWADIQRFSDLDSGSFPLLRTLNIARGIEPSRHDVVTPPSHPFFSGAIGLKEFSLDSRGSPFLSHFVFPSLTSFELSVDSEAKFRGSRLLDFLEASPMLQVVDVKILTDLSFKGIPRERVVVLQHVESLCLTTSDGGHDYKLATHISCPSVKNTSLTHMTERGPYEELPFETFPTSDSLNAIVRQYTRSPIEEVRFEMITGDLVHCSVTCSLTFRSADTTVIKLRFQVVGDNDGPDSFTCEVFSRACKTIRDLPRLIDIKHLHIYGLDVEWESAKHIAREFGGVLKSLGPLEELTICDCEMRPYFSYSSEIVAYPPIRVLMVTHSWDTLDEDAEDDLVELAKAQHKRGVPFERVMIRSRDLLVELEERLRPWVGVVDFTLCDRS